MKNQILLNYHPASQSLGTSPKQGGEFFGAVVGDGEPKAATNICIKTERDVPLLHPRKSQQNTNSRDGISVAIPPFVR